MSRVFARTFVGFLIVLLCYGAAARAADLAGAVVAIAGDCFVEADGKRTPLKMGGEVHVADTIDVPANAKVKLRMNDGSIVSIAAGSQMKITGFSVDADGKRHAVALSLTQGLLRAVVAPIDRPSTFEINTAVGSAGARSTDWFVEVQPGQMVVGVITGTVAVKSDGTGAEVAVPAGSGSSVAAGQDPTAPRVWRKAEFNALITRTDFAQPAAPKPTPAPRRASPRSDDAAEPEVPATPPAPSYNPGQGGDYNPGGGYNPAPYGGGGYQQPYGGGGGGYTPPPAGGYGGGGYGGGGYQHPGGGGYTSPGGGNTSPGGSGGYGGRSGGGAGGRY